MTKVASQKSLHKLIGKSRKSCQHENKTNFGSQEGSISKKEKGKSEKIRRRVQFPRVRKGKSV